MTGKVQSLDFDGVVNIEIPFGGSNTSYSFGDQSILQGKKIIAIVPHTDTYQAISPNNVALNTETSLKGQYISLQDVSGKVVVDTVPLTDFYPQYNSGLIKQINPTEVSWNNSRIFTPGAAATYMPSSKAAVFSVYYRNC